MIVENIWPDNGGDGVSVSDVVYDHVHRMLNTMTASVSTQTMLDVESKVSS